MKVGHPHGVPSPVEGRKEWGLDKALRDGLPCDPGGRVRCGYEWPPRWGGMAM